MIRDIRRGGLDHVDNESESGEQETGKSLVSALDKALTKAETRATVSNAIASSGAGAPATDSGSSGSRGSGSFALQVSQNTQAGASGTRSQGSSWMLGESLRSVIHNGLKHQEIADRTRQQQEATTNAGTAFSAKEQELSRKTQQAIKLIRGGALSEQQPRRQPAQTGKRHWEVSHKLRLGRVHLWSAEAEDIAIADLEQHLFAPRSTAARRSAVRKYEETCRGGHPCEPWPVTIGSLTKFMARMRTELPRSARPYSFHIVTSNVLRGHVLDELTRIMWRKMRKGATRGMGPKRKATPLTLPLRRMLLGKCQEAREKCVALACTQARSVTYGIEPLQPKQPGAVEAAKEIKEARVRSFYESTVSFFWHLRTDEAENLTVSSVSFDSGYASLQVGGLRDDGGIKYTGSKSDQEGAGFLRRLGCCCEEAKERGMKVDAVTFCPYHALEWLFNDAFLRNDEKLLTTGSQARLVRCLRDAGIDTQEPDPDKPGRMRNMFTSHCNRRAGAKSMAAYGETREVIGFWGRWSLSGRTCAVDEYIEGAHVDSVGHAWRFPYPNSVLRAAESAAAKAASEKQDEVDLKAGSDSSDSEGHVGNAGTGAASSSASAAADADGGAKRKSASKRKATGASKAKPKAKAATTRGSASRSRSKAKGTTTRAKASDGSGAQKRAASGQRGRGASAQKKKARKG